MSPLLWLAGVDDEILAKCPGERRKLAAMGATVAITVGFATVAATFTVHRFLHTSTTVGIVAGVSWGLAILALDRFLVISIRRQRTKLSTFLMALPRVALALAVGLAIAPPFLLKMFEGEVSTLAAEERQQVYQTGRQALDRRYSEITTIESSVNALVHKIDTNETGQGLAANPAYQLAAGEASSLRAEAQSASTKALCELDGTCGTRHVGEGPVYTKKAAHAASLKSEAAAAQERVDQLRERLIAEQASSASQASAFDRQELAQLRLRLGGLRGERAQQEAHLRGEYERRIGLADRLDALSTLEKSHPSVRHWSLIITLLIVSIDTAPALGKTFMAAGEPTLYEQELQREERVAGQKNELRARSEIEAERIEAQTTVDEARLKRRLWEPEMTKIVAEYVTIQGRLARQYLQRWSVYATKLVDRLSDDAFRSNPSTGPEDISAQDGASAGPNARAKHPLGLRSPLWRVRRRRG